MKRLRNNIGIVLMGLGSLLSAAAFSLRAYSNYRSNALVKQYYKVQENSKLSYRIEETQLQEVPLEPAVEQKSGEEKEEEIFIGSAFLEGDTIGVLKIPKLELEVALCQGVTNETLKYAVGHFETTALPGQVGNCCIIGHRNYTYGEFFNRLDEMEQADEIQILCDQYILYYKVTDKFVVEPEQLEVLEQGDKQQITLITCTPIRSGTHRLIIQGELTSTKKMP